MIGKEEEQIASERSRADPDPDFVAKAAISRISASVAWHGLSWFESEWGEMISCLKCKYSLAYSTESRFL